MLLLRMYKCAFKRHFFNVYSQNNLKIVNKMLGLFSYSFVLPATKNLILYIFSPAKAAKKQEKLTNSDFVRAELFASTSFFLSFYLCMNDDDTVNYSFTARY